MVKKKKLLMFGGMLFILLIGGIGCYLTFMRSNEIETIPVAHLSTSWWGDLEESSGYIASNMTQEVMLENFKTVKEVLVAEGDRVQVGDPLIVYDQSLKELELQVQQSKVKGLDVQIQLAKKELQNLQSMSSFAIGSNQAKTVTASQEEGMDAKEGLNYNSEFFPLEDGTYQVEAHQKDRLHVSFLYRLKGLDEVGKTTVFAPMKLILIVLSDDGNKESFFIDGEGLKIPEGVVSMSVGDYLSLIKDEILEPDGEKVPGQEEPPISVEPPAAQPDDEEPVQDGTEGEDTYSKEELQQLIQEKRSAVRGLELDYKEALLKEQQIKKEIEQLTVRSSVNGVVKKVEDLPSKIDDGTPLLVVTSDEGFYLKGTLNEYQLAKVDVGQVVDIQSYETGMSYEARITEIYPYPVEDNQDWGPKVSRYPFVATIEGNQQLSPNMNVSVTLKSPQEEGQTLYIDMAYVGEDHGQKFVYKVDQNKRLVKERVQTGKVIYGSYIEILSGVNEEDHLAFPYTKNIKDGLKAKVMLEGEE